MGHRSPVIPSCFLEQGHARSGFNVSPGGKDRMSSFPPFQNTQVKALTINIILE